MTMQTSVETRRGGEAPALPHGPLEEVLKDIFFVTGTFAATYGNDTWRFSRNMTVVRQGESLTLFNSVRLDASGLKALEALGTVEHVVKLGAGHGADDPFYLRRYGAVAWAPPGSQGNRRLLGVDGSPVAGAETFVFETAKEPEAAVRLPQHDGVLVVCDAWQNWKEADRFFDARSAALMTEYGMVRPSNIPAAWLQSAGTQRSDFDRLLQLRFKHVLPGHGTPAIGDGLGQVEQAIERAFSAG